MGKECNVQEQITTLTTQVEGLTAWREQAERTIRAQAQAVDYAITLKMERDAAVALLRRVYEGDMARDHDEDTHDAIGALLADYDSRKGGG